MADSTIIKVSSKAAARGDMGQKELASGKVVSMRMWENEEPGQPKKEAARDYETVGFVVKGRAELRIEGQVVSLEPGDSWVVAKGAKHTYKIVEAFTAVEANSPPAR